MVVSGTVRLLLFTCRRLLLLLLLLLRLCDVWNFEGVSCEVGDSSLACLFARCEPRASSYSENADSSSDFTPDGVQGVWTAFGGGAVWRPMPALLCIPGPGGGRGGGGGGGDDAAKEERSEEAKEKKNLKNAKAKAKAEEKQQKKAAKAKAKQDKAGAKAKANQEKTDAKLTPPRRKQQQRQAVQWTDEPAMAAPPQFGAGTGIHMEWEDEAVAAPAQQFDDMRVGGLVRDETHAQPELLVPEPIEIEASTCATPPRSRPPAPLRESDASAEPQPDAHAHWRVRLASLEAEY